MDACSSGTRCRSSTLSSLFSPRNRSIGQLVKVNGVALQSFPHSVAVSALAAQPTQIALSIMRVVSTSCVREIREEIKFNRGSAGFGLSITGGVDCPLKNGKTALDLARKQGHTEIVALLEVIVSRIFLLVFPLHLVQPLKSSSQAFKSVPAPQPRHQPQSSLRLSLML
eukprot:m.403101 g.403101  ORF g.403101 m.403101 type:complete len:169 (-) comp56460_c0_seq30:399-905(-)